jgi:hypothetical protein
MSDLWMRDRVVEGLSSQNRLKRPLNEQLSQVKLLPIKADCQLKS